MMMKNWIEIIYWHVEFGRLGCMQIIPKGSCCCHFGSSRARSLVGLFDWEELTCLWQGLNC